MKNRIVAAAAAALMFAACTDHSTSSATAKVAVAPPAPVVIAKPVVATEVKPQVADEVKPKPIDDGLALEHSHRARVDHMSRAVELKETGDFDGALSEARRAVFDDSTDEEALRMITRVGKFSGQQEFVAAAWGRLAAMSPDDANPLIQQARAMLTLKDYESAVKLARTATEKEPGNAEAFHVIGRAYLATGALQDAIDNFHKAVELNPDHGYALNNLGLAYLRSNQNEQAALVLRHAAEILPNVAYVQNNLGVAMERLGRTDEAKAAYQRSMDLSPKYVKARINVDRISKVANANDIPTDAQPVEIDNGSDFGSDAIVIPND